MKEFLERQENNDNSCSDRPPPITNGEAADIWRDKQKIDQRGPSTVGWSQSRILYILEGEKVS